MPPLALTILFSDVNVSSVNEGSLFFQGADKTVKGPDGLTALEATDNQAIKALLQ